MTCHAVPCRAVPCGIKEHARGPPNPGVPGPSGCVLAGAGRRAAPPCGRLPGRSDSTGAEVASDGAALTLLMTGYRSLRTVVGVGPDPSTAVVSKGGRTSDLLTHINKMRGLLADGRPAAWPADHGGGGHDEQLGVAAACRPRGRRLRPSRLSAARPAFASLRSPPAGTFCSALGSLAVGGFLVVADWPRAESGRRNAKLAGQSKQESLQRMLAMVSSTLRRLRCKCSSQRAKLWARLD